MDLALDRVFEAIALHQSLESLFAIYLLEASAEKRLGSGDNGSGSGGMVESANQPIDG